MNNKVSEQTLPSINANKTSNSIMGGQVTVLMSSVGNILWTLLASIKKISVIGTSKSGENSLEIDQ